MSLSPSAFYYRKFTAFMSNTKNTPKKSSGQRKTSKPARGKSAPRAPKVLSPEVLPPDEEETEEDSEAEESDSEIEEMEPGELAGEKSNALVPAPTTPDVSESDLAAVSPS